MNTATRFTVIGAGHGGKAMAAHLALMGFKITLYNRTFDHIEAIRQTGRDRAGMRRRRSASALASWHW